MSRRKLPKRKANRPQHRLVLRAVVFVVKLALLLAALPFAFMLFFALSIVLGRGEIMVLIAERALDWLLGPKSQEFVVTGKRRRGFLEF